MLLLPLLPAACALLLPHSHPLAREGTVTVSRRVPRAARVLASAAPRIDVEVKRDPDTGSFGLDVDQDNTVAYNAGAINPDLLLGDVIVAVNGEALEGRSVGAVLSSKEAPYTFTVERDPAVAIEGLERVLLQIIKDNPQPEGGLPTFDGIPRGFGTKAEAIVMGLEASVANGPVASADELSQGLQGFWKLLLTSDATFSANGLSGFGGSPYCSAAAHFQMFGDGTKGPPMQTVELIANSMVGSHQLAALKGEFEAEPPEVKERYPRSEYAGSAQPDAPIVERSSRCTFLSSELRICRIDAQSPDEKETVCVYRRQELSIAQGEIGEWLERPVTPADKNFDPRPAWERASRASDDAADAYLGGTDGGGALGGGGGGGRGGAGAM